MRRALQLAPYGAGHVSPNPMVGAVIVSADGRLIGQGWHRRYGGPHAEVNAFLSISPQNRHLIPSSTIYVTLEPCSHYGKTPPCAKLLIDNHIKRCVIGCGDPNPKVAGRGVAMLRDAGIEVTENVLFDQCYHLNRRFMTAQTLRRPWILLKWAQSSDRFIAPDNHHLLDRYKSDSSPHSIPDFKRLVISSPLSMMLMHRQRALVDAILVGTNTIITDNPSLTTRFWPGNSPRPVIFSSVNIPPHAEILKRDPIFLNPDIPLSENMHLLFDRFNITSIMVEGGAKLLQSFIDCGLYDEVRIETSDTILSEGLEAPVLPQTN